MSHQFETLQLSSLELFCLTAKHGGFPAAAKATGLTAAAVSRSIARLEARLGVRLFMRTTRQVRLTDAGQRYYGQCQHALEQLVEAEREITGEQTAPAGVLRLSLPTSYGHYRVLPLLPAFTRQYPAIELDLHLSNRNKSGSILNSLFNLVVTNPPYLGEKKQSKIIREYCKKNYSVGKADLATIFLVRIETLTKGNTQGLVLPQNWIYQGSYLKLRQNLLSNQRISLLCQLASNAFVSQIGVDVVMLILNDFNNKSFYGLDLTDKQII